ncbi:acyltransferase family protein [Butyrivibrio sp. MC2013]|uniref:acyltransferase family protein n=1 Tax=Butyrivibrio sp. MC2013 TaxID=1280686 RepID=UPI0018C9D8AC|nr:acyltransferase [Butyrivibrio sp. MC2013]
MAAHTVSTNGRSKRGRNGRIEILRFLFAFIVLLHHSRFLLGDDDCFFLGGSLAVEFFFIVSGYLMATSMEKKLRTGPANDLAGETGSFIKGKIRALMPLFPISWTIGLLFVIRARRLDVSAALTLIRETVGEWTLTKMAGFNADSLDGVVWYISSMLICMAILYPLLRSHHAMMQRVICPLMAIVLLGITDMISGHPRDPYKLYGYIYKGNIRAMAELSIGIWLYPRVKEFSERALSTAARIVIEIAEFTLFGALVVYMYNNGVGEADYFYIIVMTALVGLAFSGQGILSDILDNRASFALGSFSSAMYFCHIYYAQNLDHILSDDIRRIPRMLIYIAVSLATAAAAHLLSGLWPSVRALFTADTSRAKQVES